MRNSILLLATFLLYTGCSQKQTIDMEIPEDNKQVVKTPTQPVQRKGALYSRQGASLFSDKKDLQIGDIIQVVVEEVLANDSSNKKFNSKDNTTGLGAGIFANIGNNQEKINSVTGLGFNSGTSNSFSGSSGSSSSEEFTTVISAVIEQTYKNGNYFIKGSKQMLINGEKQTILISGIIRPYDIDPSNTIYSSQLANLKISYEKNGESQNALKKGWGTQILENIWPF